MSEPFIGEIKIVGFNFAPRSWAKCEGQFLSIAQNNALFALLGTTYGGNGVSTFALPDLRGRFPMNYGQGPGLSSRLIGANGGSETKTLTVNQLPSHSHTGAVVSSTAEGDRTSPSGAFPARPEEPVQPYADSGGDAMAGGSVQIDATGADQAHDIMPPFLAVNFVIALTGVFPSEN